MKKQIFGLMALIICACAGFTACSDDDDDDNNNSANIVGLWQETHCVDWVEGYDGQYNPEAWEVETDGRVEFKSNGNAVVYEYYNGSWNAEGEAPYKVSGNKLTLAGTEFTIDELSDNTLILTEKGKEDGRNFIVRSKLSRMS